MSRENVELIRAVFDAWDADDFSAMLALFDPDVVTRRVSPMPDPGAWKGTDGMLEVISEWVATFDEFEMEPVEFIDAGDRVITAVAQEGRGEAGGVPVKGTFWFAWGVRGGKVVSLDMYGSREQAIEGAQE